MMLDRSPETTDLRVQKTTKGGLDQKGMVILFVSLTLALIFIIVGVVLLATADGKGGDDELGDGSARISVDQRYSNYNAESYETYSLYIEPNNGGSYYIHITGATLISITDSYGNTLSRTSVSSSYDRCYRVYLSAGEEYCIKTDPTKNPLQVKVSQSKE